MSYYLPLFYLKFYIIYGKIYKRNFERGIFMKRLLSALLVVMILAAALPLCVSAEEMVNLYYDDGRMATVPVSMVEQCHIDGWKDGFPYAGKTIWIRNLYLWDTTDIYGADTMNILNYTDYPTFVPVTITWYDDQNFIDLGGYQKQLQYLIIDLYGTQLKMPIGDLLRGRPTYWDDTMIYWGNPQSIYGISDASWNRIQNKEMWIGMTTTEFLLYQGFRPDRINTSNYGNGVTEQWVYDFSNGASYYYFRNGVLDSWQRY